MSHYRQALGRLKRSPLPLNITLPGMEPPFSDREKSDASAVADDSLGHPAQRTPEEGIKDMVERMTQLTIQRNAQILVRDSQPYGRARAFTGGVIRDLDRQINEAKSRLAEYEAQLKGRN